jgi:drug/metabolite transporter (DMT)-like permease
MIGGLVSALFFGVTPVAARRAIRLVGFVKANAARLAIALVVLGVASVALGQGFGEETWLLISAGVVGLGVGGVALYRALPLLGAPLASLVVETTAALVAGAGAWIWFGDAPSLESAGAAIVVLGGVVLGLAPFVRQGGRPPRLPLGLGMALLAAAAQGTGLVITRKALLDMQERWEEAGVSARPALEQVVSASFDRLVGGLAVALAAWAVVWALARWTGMTGARSVLSPAGGYAPGPDRERDDFGALGSRLPDKAWFWVGANALVGPIVGVTALVWALRALQPGLAQTITALAALISVPVAHWLEGHEQPASFWVGASVSAAGLVGLVISF